MAVSSSRKIIESKLMQNPEAYREIIELSKLEPIGLDVNLGKNGENVMSRNSTIMKQKQTK